MNENITINFTQRIRYQDQEKSSHHFIALKMSVKRKSNCTNDVMPSTYHHRGHHRTPIKRQKSFKHQTSISDEIGPLLESTCHIQAARFQRSISISLIEEHPENERNGMKQQLDPRRGVEQIIWSLHGHGGGLTEVDGRHGRRHHGGCFLAGLAHGLAKPILVVAGKLQQVGHYHDGTIEHDEKVSLVVDI